MDLVLEQHEKDFLAAYRKHMIAVQKELTQLKQKGTDQELQMKQDKKIAHLQREIAKFRQRCMDITEESKM